MKLATFKSSSYILIVKQSIKKTFDIAFYTSLNVDSLIGRKLPKIESTCLTTIIGLEIYLDQKQLQ